MPRRRRRLVLACLSALVALALGELFVRRQGDRPWRANVASPDEAVLHEYDPVRGWRNKEGSYRVGPFGPHQSPLCVTMWSRGRRATAPVERARPRRVVVLGCSYTQGWAVTDEQTYAWRLQERFPDVEVMNYGTAAYNTLQSLLALEQHYATVGDADVVLFGLASVHEERNLGEMRWLRTLAIGASRQHVWLPWADLDERGALRRHGLVRYPVFPFREQSALVAMAERVYARWRYPARVAEREAVTWRLVQALRDCAEAHGSTFLVAVLGWQPEVAAYLHRLEDEPIAFVDCVAPYSPRWYVRGEGHPNRRMNELWAEWMTPLLASALATH